MGSKEKEESLRCDLQISEHFFAFHSLFWGGVSFVRTDTALFFARFTRAALTIRPEAGWPVQIQVEILRKI